VATRLYDHCWLWVTERIQCKMAGCAAADMSSSIWPRLYLGPLVLVVGVPRWWALHSAGSCQTVDSQWQGRFGCCATYLEQFALQLCPITVIFLPATLNISLPPIISWVTLFSDKLMFFLCCKHVTPHSTWRWYLLIRLL